jgi:hypothetical protein
MTRLPPCCRCAAAWRLRHSERRSCSSPCPTFGLVGAVWTCSRLRPAFAPGVVAAYITGAFWPGSRLRSSASHLGQGFHAVAQQPGELGAVSGRPADVASPNT